MINNGKEVKGLMMFDFLVNTDLGLIKFIREQMRDDRAFKLDIVDKSDRELLSLLYSKDTTNPLEIITTDENAENIPKLYQSFRDNYLLDILSYSYVDQALYDFVNMCNDNTTGVSLAICTSCEEEKIFIKKIFDQKIDTCSIEDIDIFLMKDPYYVKHISLFYDLALINKLRCKTIYLPPTKYNILCLQHINDHFTNLNVFKFMGESYQPEEEGENYDERITESSAEK